MREVVVNVVRVRSPTSPLGTVHVKRVSVVSVYLWAGVNEFLMLDRLTLLNLITSVVNGLLNVDVIDKYVGVSSSLRRHKWFS